MDAIKPKEQPDNKQLALPFDKAEEAKEEQQEAVKPKEEKPYVFHVPFDCR